MEKGHKNGTVKKSVLPFSHSEHSEESLFFEIPRHCVSLGMTKDVQICDFFYSPIAYFLQSGVFLYPLIVFGFDLEVCLGMTANRAEVRCFFANLNVTAVGTLPDTIAIFGEYQITLHVSKKF